MSPATPVSTLPARRKSESQGHLQTLLPPAASHFACHGGCRLLFHIVLWTELGPRGPWWHKGGISEGLWELGRAADHESLSPEWIYRALQRCGWRLGIDAASSVCVELELYLRDSV